jgi:hypothetical protein
MGNFWKGKPILAWVVDDFEQFNQILSNTTLDFDKYLKDYTQDVYSNEISKLIFSSPFSFNLGGETKKNKLIATDKPIGVFNFSLASKTLYPLSEFFSQKLKDEDPNRFSSLNLLSGVVPNILVEFIVIGGENKYYYKDERGVEYPCEKRIKGQTAIDNGVPNAKLEYKSKTKKVYQTYKRKGGKVRYVEIYSLFYYDRVIGNLQFAIRHLPAMMVAEYLESIGIKVRIYMTRFVELENKSTLVNLREFDVGTNAKLPMYEQPIVQTRNNEFPSQLLIQPIIAKEFQQEINNPLAYLISSASYNKVYEKIAQNTIEKETTQGWISVYGEPKWSQERYREGFERYRNKYAKYVEDGLFKSKEVLPESMIFFHDMSINMNLASFLGEMVTYVRNKNSNVSIDEADALLKPEVNIFFVWWMKTSANIIKHKVNLINSNELNKDMREIKSELQNSILENKTIIQNTQDDDLKLIFESYSDRIFRKMDINFITLANGVEVVDFDNYINQLVKELTVFADDDFFPTPEDEVERRLDFKDLILDELKKL